VSNKPKPKPTDRRELERVARNVAAYVKHELGEGVGVAFVFDFGPPGHGNIAYVSTADRSDMIETIRAWLVNVEAGLATDPPGPRPKS
jgi:hypothetical protein